MHPQQAKSNGMNVALSTSRLLTSFLQLIVRTMRVFQNFAEVCASELKILTTYLVARVGQLRFNIKLQFQTSLSLNHLSLNRIFSQKQKLALRTFSSDFFLLGRHYNPSGKKLKNNETTRCETFLDTV